MKRKRKTHMSISDTDVAFVFREDGHVDVSFPEIKADPVPDHVMAALALSSSTRVSFRSLGTWARTHQALKPHGSCLS